MGMAPLPWEQAKRHYGLGTRSWHFCLPLVKAGHQVDLVLKKMFDAYGDAVPSNADDANYPNLSIQRLEAADFHNITEMRIRLSQAEPDCIIGVNMEGASVVCQADLPVPIWADLNGYSMGEAQARHRVVGDQDDPHVMWMQLLPVLLRADVFSAVSAAQRFALIGELGSAGRLAADSFGYEFVHHIPNAVQPPPPEGEAIPVLEGFGEPHGVFWVLWSGGFNTWADTETLVDGLEGAMDRAPELRFVSTGGQIGNHDPVTYASFKERVRSSRFSDRFYLLDWVDSETVTALYSEADMGISVDKRCYEMELGARNRLNAMMRFGLPVLTTYGSEISKIIERNGLGLVVDTADAKGLASALTWAAENRERLTNMGRRGQQFVLEKFSFSATTRAVQTWADSPAFAPDNLRKRAGGEPWNTELERRASLLADISHLEDADAELRRIHHTRAFAVYRRLKALLKSLTAGRI